VAPTKTPAAERVYTLTKEQILRGDLPAGTLLSEAETAKLLEVSRTPTREAFVRLAAEGLLSLLPRRGALVTPVAPTEALDVLELRLALESGAVRRLARLPDDRTRRARLAAAQAAIDEQTGHADRGDADGVVVADERFHLELVRAADNALASRFYATLSERQRRMTARAISLNAARLIELAPEHQDLLDIAARGDVDGFLTALAAHLSRTHAVLAGVELT
jgi:DNA-binding GntR family transcriptional regulator